MLRPADAPRAGAQRSPRAETDWRVSRALLQAVPGDAEVALTHKLGHAAVACAPRGWRVGVDLEAIRPRDIDRLAPWMAVPHEIESLRRLDPEAALRHFYRLWTFKEAMIKARGLDFPEGLKRSELSLAPEGGSGIRTKDGERWSAAVFESLPDWTLSVVWQAPQGRDADIAWHMDAGAPASDFRLWNRYGGADDTPSGGVDVPGR